MKVEIYGFDPKHFKCVPCINAKRLADIKKLDYKFIPVSEGEGPILNKQIIDQLVKRLNRRSEVGLTMPQIFIDDKSIGGFDKFKEFINER
ncbi:thioredoxin [Proteus phage SJ_PmiM]|nr:thioredoxin [Proteus phage SJ_PmiM]